MPVPILMPALSPTMTEGTLAKWHVKEGDNVESGDVIAEIETDKATMEVEAVDEGKIGRIVVVEGTQNVAVNETIALILEDGEDSTNLDAAANDMTVCSTSDTSRDKPVDTSASVSPGSKNSCGKDAQDVTLDRGNGKADRVFASPLARRIAQNKNIDLSQVKGSGPRGRIVKSDLEGAAANAATGSVAQSSGSIQSGSTQSGPDARFLADAYGMEYEEISNNNIRKVVARRLTEAKQTIPHFYLTMDFQLDALLHARKTLNSKADGAYKISVNDFIIKACAMALQAYPAANVAWTDDAILQFKHADISVAVATPDGLITPIVKKAETKGLVEISTEMKDLAGRARQGKLKPQEFQGGTFSISNLGMYGVSDFSAIINPPQSCILAVGAGEQRPYVEDGSVRIGHCMRATLSTDHRSVDGAVGAEFLKTLKTYIENPVSMLL